MSKRLKIIVLSAVLVLLSYGIYQIFKSSSGHGMNGQYVPISTVSAMTIKEEAWQPRIKATGTLKAINGVDVTTEIAGIVKSISIDSGVDVKKGDLILELNADTEIAQLTSLLAQVELAQITYERDKKQFEVRAVSKAIVDVDEADLKSKKALAAQQATIVAKKRIIAPFSGRLGINEVDLGQYLKPGDKIVTLQELNPIYVDFNLPQQDIPKIRVDQEVVLTTDTYPNMIFKGKITTINPLVDPATRNVEVEATLLNPDGKLFPGMFGQVELNTGKSLNYLTLPQAAITYNPYGDLVYILKEKEKNEQGVQVYTAFQKFLNLGETRGDQVQILKGLEPGDLVVTSGQMKLKNGSLVTINNTVAPSNNPKPQLKNH